MIQLYRRHHLPEGEWTMSLNKADRRGRRKEYVVRWLANDPKADDVVGEVQFMMRTRYDAEKAFVLLFDQPPTADRIESLMGEVTEEDE